MKNANELAIKYYTENHVPNPSPGNDLSWPAYQRMRNHVIRACRQCGPVKGVGEWIIPPRGEEEWPWSPGDSEGPYSVEVDQYDSDLYIYVDIDSPAAFNWLWIEAIVKVLKDHAGWGVGVRCLSNGYVLIFADRLLVTGQALRTCKNVADVICAVQEAMKLDQVNEQD